MHRVKRAAQCQQPPSVTEGSTQEGLREFGDLEGRVWLKEDTESFIPFYMRWANSLLSVAHPSFMQVFAEWFYEQLGAKASERTFDASTLYATAFEFTAIGAAREVELMSAERS